MKKTPCLYNLKIVVFSLFCGCLFFILNSCGLDTYVVVKSPISVGKEVNYTTTDYSNMYFEFNTNEDMGTYYPSDFTFLGTEVYYKIYSNSSTLTSEVSVLQNLAGSTESSANAADKLINPTTNGGYGYKALKASNSNYSPLIPPKYTNFQKVYIRLTNYQNIEEFSARITVDGKPIGLANTKSVPIRSDNAMSFDFGRNGSKDGVPLSTDGDVKYTTSNSTGNWFVAMFAVGVGRDVTYTTQYSNILYLGSVTINSRKTDN